jgi:hypothetical protein
MVLAPAAPPVSSRADYLAAAVHDLELQPVPGAEGGAAPRQDAAAPPPLQLLERRDDGVLATTVFSVDGPTGRRRVVSVIAFTAIAGTRLSADFYGPDSGPEALQPVRDAAVAYLARLVAANPEPRAGFPWLIAVLVAALVVVAGAALYWFVGSRRSA